MKKSQLLLKLDMEYIKSHGLPLTTPALVSNMDDYGEAPASGSVDPGTEILRIEA